MQTPDQNKIEQAKAKIKTDAYEDDQCLDIVVDRILEDLQGSE